MRVSASEVIKHILIFISVYPIALITQVVLESGLGDSLFISEAQYGSIDRLVHIVLHDWAASGILIVPILVLGLFLLKFTPIVIWRLGISLLLVITLAATFYMATLPGLLGLTIAYALLALFVDQWWCR